MSEWQPIETAPRTKKEVLLYCGETKEQFVGFHHSGSLWQFAQNWDGTEIVCRPDFWMPLPEPPEES